jgi:UDP-glucose 4-epimerase
MICCVIGGNGFIGQHLVRVLTEVGKNVIVIGRNAIAPKTLPEGVRYFSGDCGDSYFLRKVLSDVDEIVDLSYASVPKTSFVDPINDILLNLPSHLNLFEVASSLPIKKLVIVSSGGTVYGKANYLPITEDHPLEPISPYGITKLVVEKYASMYNLNKGLPFLCVRPSNAFGEGQKPFVGQGFVSTAIASALEGKSISVFGENGTVRDYIHVSDVAFGIAAALEKGVVGECYNIGSGNGINNIQMIDLLTKIAYPKGYTFSVDKMPARQNDVTSNILDYSKLHNATGWIPKLSLESGLELTWNHFYRLYNP